MDYSFRIEARILLNASSHRQDDTYHGLCYTSRGALAGTRNSSMGDRKDADFITQMLLYVISELMRQLYT